MKILQLEQGSQEWLEKRKCCITSTDAASIMGLNPYKSRKDVLKQKLGLGQEQEENEAMKQGRELEPKAREVYMLQENVIVIPEVCVHDEYFWAMASLDGLAEGGQHIVEIKCGKSAFEQAQRGEIPQYYRCQMQHALFVTDLKVCHYFCFWEGKSILLVVHRDEEFILKLIEEEKKFYDEMLFKEVVPLLLRFQQMAQRQKMTDPASLIINQNDDKRLEEAIKRFEHHKLTIESHEALKELAKQEIIDLCEGRDTEAFGYKITKNYFRGRIKYDAIPDITGIDLEKYRSEGFENWTIKKLK